MKLAVKKDAGEMQGMGGYHYMLHPFPMKDDCEASMYFSMGYAIVEVPDAEGERLVTQAKAALAHQMEVAILTERKRVL